MNEIFWNSDFWIFENVFKVGFWVAWAGLDNDDNDSWMFVYVKPKLRVRNQLLRIIFQINARENLSEKKHVKNL